MAEDSRSKCSNHFRFMRKPEPEKSGHCRMSRLETHLVRRIRVNQNKQDSRQHFRGNSFSSDYQDYMQMGDFIRKKETASFEHIRNPSSGVISTSITSVRNAEGRFDLPAVDASAAKRARLDTRAQATADLDINALVPASVNQAHRELVRSQHEGRYELSPLMAKALESELADLMPKVENIVTKYKLDVPEKIHVRSTIALRNSLGVNITKRLLAPGQSLNVKVTFCGDITHENLKQFVKMFDVKLFKRFIKTGNTFIVKVPDYEKFDALCSTGQFDLNGMIVEAEPFRYIFNYCPRNLKTRYNTNSNNVDNINTEASNSSPNIKKEKTAPDAKQIIQDKTAPSTANKVVSNQAPPKVIQPEKKATQTSVTKVPQSKPVTAKVVATKPNQPTTNQNQSIKTVPNKMNIENANKPIKVEPTSPTKPVEKKVQDVKITAAKTAGASAKVAPTKQNQATANENVKTTPSKANDSKEAAKVTNNEAAKPVKAAPTAAKVTPIKPVEKKDAVKTTDAKLSVSRQNTATNLVAAKQNQTTAATNQSPKTIPNKPNSNATVKITNAKVDTESKPNTAANQNAKTTPNNPNATVKSTDAKVTPETKPNTTTKVVAAKQNQTTTATNESVKMTPNNQNPSVKSIDAKVATESKPNTITKVVAKQNQTTTPTNQSPKTTPNKQTATVISPGVKVTQEIKQNTAPKVVPAKQNQSAITQTVKTTVNKANEIKEPTKVTNNEAAKIDKTAPKPTPTKVTQAKPVATSNKNATTKSIPKAASSNLVKTSQATSAKKTQVAKKKESDFDELDDHDILALLSGGIVLDECSGSDDEK